MEMFKKAFLSLAVLAAVTGGAVGTGTALADHGHGRSACDKRAQSRNDRYAQWRHHRANQWRQMAKALDLTHEQRSQIRDIFGKNREEASPVRKQLSGERRTLRNLVQADTPDEGAIRAEVQKVAAIEGDLAVRRARVFGEIKAVMTSDQQKKFKGLQEKKAREQDRMMEREGRHSEEE